MSNEVKRCQGCNGSGTWPAYDGDGNEVGDQPCADCGGTGMAPTPDTISRPELLERIALLEDANRRANEAIGNQATEFQAMLTKQRTELLEWLRKEHKQARQEDLSGGYALERVISHIESL